MHEMNIVTSMCVAWHCRNDCLLLICIVDHQHTSDGLGNLCLTGIIVLLY